MSLFFEIPIYCQLFELRNRKYFIDVILSKFLYAIFLYFFRMKIVIIIIFKARFSQTNISKRITK